MVNSLEIKPFFSSPWYGTFSEVPENFGGYGTTSCGICLEDFIADHELFGLPCKHVFHAVCLKDWQPNNPSCPTCLQRFDIVVEKINFFGHSLFFRGESQQIAKKIVNWKWEEEILSEEALPKKRKNFLMDQLESVLNDLTKEERPLFFEGIRKIAQNTLNLCGESGYLPEDLTQEEVLLIRKVLENESFLKATTKGLINFVDLDVLRSNKNASLVRYIGRYILIRVLKSNKESEEWMTRTLNLFFKQGVFAFLSKGCGEKFVEQMVFFKHFRRCTISYGRKEYLKSLSWKEQSSLKKLCLSRKSRTSRKIVKGISAVQKEYHQVVLAQDLKSILTMVFFLSLAIFVHCLSETRANNNG